MPCRAFAGDCSGAAAVAGTRACVIGRRHYLAPSLLAALGAYGEHFGHVRVPQKFVVPDAEGWPAEVRGLELGKQVKGACERRRSMARCRKTMWRSWRRCASCGTCPSGSGSACCSRCWREVHGDLQVPRPFAVPSEAPWPEDAWGMKLGERVHNIRSLEQHVKHHPERRAELDALGFVWDEFERRWEEVPAALLVYQDVHGDMQVPRPFAVPSEAPWPEEAWGVKLGHRVHNILYHEQHMKHHPERRVELDAMGFRWSARAW